MIRHAMLALSSQLEAFAKSKHKTVIDLSQERYALLHHGQSLQLIRQCLEESTSTDGLMEVLFAVFLAIVFELMRGNDLAALTHLEGALSALDVSERRVRHRRNTDFEAIRRVFARLEIHALSFVGARTPSRANLIPAAISLTAEADGQETDDPRHAQKALRKFGDHLASLEYQCHQAMRCDHQMIDLLITGLEDWNTHFQPLLCLLEQRKGSSRSKYVHEVRQCYLLHIRYMIMLMRLDAFRQACETAFDTYQNFFDRITTLADGILQAENSKLFTLELELVEPLYFTVLKCRKPEIRSKALALLKSSGQEGVWDGPYMAAIAHEVILVEERLFKTHVTAGTSQSYGSQTLAELMWDERENPNAESGRVCAVALIEYDRKNQSALIECSFKSGSVRSVVNSATTSYTNDIISI
ncbi:hypothetical protein yc1106_02394 [Curvularia clavata]|uniref:Uncharacterized protein n=1 Tax=Curvularia clavata TaxID=95742 RepID=A0A9Q8Z3Q0_CURCL|nr:hypothetical protein yc1106_02394 [Curvularia clavata]